MSLILAVYFCFTNSVCPFFYFLCFRLSFTSRGRFNKLSITYLSNSASLSTELNTHFSTNVHHQGECRKYWRSIDEPLKPEMTKLEISYTFCSFSFHSCNGLTALYMYCYSCNIIHQKSDYVELCYSYDRQLIRSVNLISFTESGVWS